MELTRNVLIDPANDWKEDTVREVTFALAARSVLAVTVEKVLSPEVNPVSVETLSVLIDPVKAVNVLVTNVE